MTIRKFLFILATTASVLASCSKAEQEKETSRFTLSTTSVNAPAEGGSYTVSFTSNSGWWASTQENWITLSAKQGGASEGSQSITVTVARNNDVARTGSVTFQSGSTEAKVSVSQATGISADGIKTLTITEFIAEKDNTETWFRLSGDVISISSYTYGDLYMKDDTGFIYVYGLAPEKGGSNSDFSKTGLVAGDKITIVAHRKTYNGVNETDGAYLEKKTAGTYPGSSSKTASAKWLELPATASSSSDMVFLTHRSENGKRNYSIYYNKAERVARWICYAYVSGQGGTGRNNDPYAFDPLVDQNDQPNLSKSYTETSRKIGGYEYVRGHMLPSNDRSGRENYDVFLATNIMPQSSSLNSGMWSNLETKKIHSSWAAKCDTVYVVTGTDTKTSLGKVKDIDGKEVVVPSGIYKVVLAHTKQGEYKALGAYFDNTSNPGDEFTKAYAMSVDDLEKKVGEDFFVNLSSEVQTSVEAAKPADDDWWWN